MLNPKLCIVVIHNYKKKGCVEWFELGVPCS
jgi:hypothetical protein